MQSLLLLARCDSSFRTLAAAQFLFSLFTFRLLLISLFVTVKQKIESLQSILFPLSVSLSVSQYQFVCQFVSLSKCSRKRTHI